MRKIHELSNVQKAHIYITSHNHLHITPFHITLYVNGQTSCAVNHSFSPIRSNHVAVMWWKFYAFPVIRIDFGYKHTQMRKFAFEFLILCVLCACACFFFFKLNGREKLKAIQIHLCDHNTLNGQYLNEPTSIQWQNSKLHRHHVTMILKEWTKSGKVIIEFIDLSMLEIKSTRSLYIFNTEHTSTNKFTPFHISHVSFWIRIFLLCFIQIQKHIT